MVMVKVLNLCPLSIASKVSWGGIDCPKELAKSKEHAFPKFSENGWRLMIRDRILNGTLENFVSHVGKTWNKPPENFQETRKTCGKPGKLDTTGKTLGKLD